MGTEVERKFVVQGEGWRDASVSATHIMQGYVAQTGGTTVRVRLAGDHGRLTVKGASTGITRAEFEYEIPVADAHAMLATLATGPVIDKVRHRVPVGGHVWEVDVFAGDNAPLVLAEVELDDPDQPFVRPDWAAREVSEDPRYFNVNLARDPYSTWS